MLFCTQSDNVCEDIPPTQAPTPSGQLSDPFKNMCLASQGMIIGLDMTTQRPPVPLFSQTVPTNSSSDGIDTAPEIPCSQFDVLGTQDFITPADQFDLDYDPAAGGVRQRSPAQLSPNRIKRARKAHDGVENGPSVILPSLGIPHGRATSNPAFTGGPAIQRRHITRIHSPPCYRNMFQIDNENENETFKDLRARRPSSAQHLSRFRIDFKELGCIGQGSFSKVFRARHRIEGKMYAIKRTIKEVTPEQPEFGQFVQEAQVLAHLDPHPNIISYYGCWTEHGLDGGERLFMQLELCDVSLETHVGLGGRMTEAEIIELARQVASGLEYIHSKGVAHLDIKPSNIYIKIPEEGVVVDNEMNWKDANFDSKANSIRLLPPGALYKLGDFGQATRLVVPCGNNNNNPSSTSSSAAALREVCVNEGDSRYLPLELLNSDYSALDKADMFSFGAMLFELASGRALPEGGQTYEDLRKGRVPLLPHATQKFMKLIKLLLSPNPQERPSAAKVLLMAPIAMKKPDTRVIQPDIN